jgi:hypothetical protein
VVAENEAGELILSTTPDPQILATARVFFVTGLTIMGWLFWKYHGNYIRIMNRIIT